MELESLDERLTETIAQKRVTYTVYVEIIEAWEYKENQSLSHGRTLLLFFLQVNRRSANLKLEVHNGMTIILTIIIYF